MKHGRCRRQHLAAVVRRAAFPVCDDAACGFDHGDRGLNVVRIEPCFYHNINLTRGK